MERRTSKLAFPTAGIFFQPTFFLPNPQTKFPTDKKKSPLGPRGLFSRLCRFSVLHSRECPDVSWNGGGNSPTDIFFQPTTFFFSSTFVLPTDQKKFGRTKKVVPTDTFFSPRAPGAGFRLCRFSVEFLPVQTQSTAQSPFPTGWGPTKKRWFPRGLRKPIPRIAW